MKVIFVVPELKCGGAEHVSVIFAKILNNCEVKFVNLGQKSGELEKFISPHFSIISLDKKRSIMSLFALKRTLKNEKPDFVFASNTHVSVILLLISTLDKLKIIVRMPTMPTNKLYKGIKVKILKLLERMLYKRAYKIIAQTEEMKQEISSIFKIKSDKIITITNPVDEESIKEQTANCSNPFDSNNINYLAVGNISYAKAYDILIKAFIHTYKRNSKAHLYILGRHETEYAKSIITMAKDHISNIHFLGFCSTPYIYMNYCTALILSSRMEGLPNVVLEAMYLNKAIVATTCVPIIESLIKNGINGYKVKPENIIELSEAMEKAVLLTDIKNCNTDSKEIIRNIFK